MCVSLSPPHKKIKGKERRESGGGVFGEEAAFGARKRKKKEQGPTWALLTVVQNFKNPLSLLLKGPQISLLPRACSIFIGHKRFRKDPFNP